MTILYINTGSSPNRGDGDTLRTAFNKINANFDYVVTTFNTGSGGANLGNYKIEYGVIGTHGSTPSGWGNTAVILDPGGESNAGIYIPSVSAQQSGSDLQIYNNYAETGGRIQLTTAGGSWHFNQNGSLTAPGHMIPDTNLTHDLGSTSSQWRSLYVGTSTIYLGGTPLTVSANGDLVVNGNAVGLTQPYLELTNDPFIFNPLVGEPVTFTKIDYATGSTATDFIDVQMAISRANNQGIYNPYFESSWDDTTSDGLSPAGTLWNKDGWGDLTNLNQRIYLSFYETFLRYGNNVLTAEAVMKDVANNKYYKFDFTVWGNSGQGAPLTYIRTQINPTTGATIGDPVTFVKAGYADPTQVNDPIDTNLTIARGNNQSIYNIALEQGYSTQGDGRDSPEGTLWNADSWGTLRDVKQRYYDTFYSVLGQQVGNNILGTELVMHDTINDKYYAIKFNSWTQSGNGGGFSYTRQQINTSQLFVKTDYGSEVDVIIEDDGNGAGVGITRGENQGIYNPYREGSWDSDISPDGTLWNTAGWNDLRDLTSRPYTNFYAAYGSGNLGNRIPGSRAIMYVPDNGKYYGIQWLSWTQNNNGGGFSYLRYEIDTTKLDEGIRFADGSILKSAEGVGRVKSIASSARRIEEASGNKTVSVTSIVTSNHTGTTYQNITAWELRVTRTPELDAVLDPYWNDQIIGERFYVSFDNATYRSAYISSKQSDHWIFYYNVAPNPTAQVQGNPFYIRIENGGTPVVWWDKNDLPGGSDNFRGAVIDYHAFTGDATFIGTIHIVDDNGEENITHTEVSSGSSDSENDDLWLVQNEGTISYRRIDGAPATLRMHWTAKIFYGSEIYD